MSTHTHTLTHSSLGALTFYYYVLLYSAAEFIILVGQKVDRINNYVLTISLFSNSFDSNASCNLNDDLCKHVILMLFFSVVTNTQGLVKDDCCPTLAINQLQCVGV